MPVRHHDTPQHAAVPQPLSKPCIKAGDCTGAWQLQQNASEGIELAMAELGGGRLALQLTSTSTSVAGLHDIKVWQPSCR